MIAWLISRFDEAHHRGVVDDLGQPVEVLDAVGGEVGGEPDQLLLGAVDLALALLDLEPPGEREAHRQPGQAGQVVLEVQVDGRAHRHRDQQSTVPACERHHPGPAGELAADQGRGAGVDTGLGEVDVVDAGHAGGHLQQPGAVLGLLGVVEERLDHRAVPLPGRDPRAGVVDLLGGDHLGAQQRGDGAVGGGGEPVVLAVPVVGTPPRAAGHRHQLALALLGPGPGRLPGGGGAHAALPGSSASARAGSRW